MPDYDQSPSLQRDQTNDEMTTRLESGPETKPEPFVPNMDGPEIELAADYALANECLEEPERDVWKTIKSIFTRKKKKEQPDPEPEVVEKVVKKVKVVAVRKKTTVQSPETVKEPESSGGSPTTVESTPTTPEVTKAPETTPEVNTTPETTVEQAPEKTPESSPKPVTPPPLNPLQQVQKEIRDGHADKALELLKTQTPTSRTTVWSGLNNGERKAVTDLLSKGTLGDGLLKALFDATPNSDLAALYKLFDVRFGVKVGQTKSTSDTGADWDAAGLRRCWAVLKDLPEEHVRGNAWLEHWTRYQAGGSAGGYYSKRDKESSMGYDSRKIDAKNGAADRGDPLYKVVRFDKVVRHEVGHAVDVKVGGSAYTVGNVGGGNWEEHGRPKLQLVETMVAASGGAISKLKTEHKALVMGAILKAMKDGKPEDTKPNIEKLDIAKGDKPELSSGDLAKVLADPVVTTSEISGTGKNPWYKAPGQGVDLGGRHYQASYGKTWVSYDRSSLARKVSTYQHRAPGEWFAEAYATYFQPDGDGKIGTLLAARDPTTKSWFDANVVPQEKKEPAPVEPEKVENSTPDSGGGDPGKKG
ncbi:MAG: hypothetical protein H6744_19780 [Deltaproteobacteria bacterium]|nr:hypothetical protein [Deltaproteobacteria bacterium]MCB9788923.1 hypothetical protein [Deltaproteobacteria bacterium]